MQRPRALVAARMSPRHNSRTRFLVETLARDFEVTVISEATTSEMDSEFLPHVQLKEVTLLWPHRSSWHLLGLIRVAHFTWRALMEVPRNMVVVCSDVPYAVPLIVAKLFFRRVTVLNAHEIAWALGAHPFISYAMRVLEGLVLRTSDLFLVPSKERARIMLSAHRIETPYEVYANFPVMPASVTDTPNDRDEPGLAGPPVVMFQGSLCKGRGLEALLEGARDGSFDLIVQGRGALLPHLLENAHEHVRFLELCPNELVVPSLACADLAFVYYENDCLNSAWACSSKFYAAVFAGKPVICNRLPAFEAFASESGGCVFLDSLEPTDIRAKVQEATRTPGLYPRLVSEMRKAHHELREARLRDGLAARFEEVAASVARNLSINTAT